MSSANQKTDYVIGDPGVIFERNLWKENITRSARLRLKGISNVRHCSGLKDLYVCIQGGIVK